MRTDLTDPRILAGMRAQLQARRDRIALGEEPIGWKVGFGAPQAQERLKLTAPLVGYLMQSGFVPPGAAVPLAGWVKPVAEPEIAVHIGRDLAAGGDLAEARAAIAALGPAIELADLDPPPDDVERALAGNLFQRHVVLGSADPAGAGGSLAGFRGTIRRNGVEAAATTDPEALTGGIVDIVRHVADVLGHFGERLRAGEFIIAGSIVPPFFLEATDTELAYEAAPFGGISVRFVH